MNTLLHYEAAIATNKTPKKLMNPITDVAIHPTVITFTRSGLATGVLRGLVLRLFCRNT